MKTQPTLTQTLSLFLFLLATPFFKTCCAQSDEPYYVYDASALQRVDRCAPEDVKRVWDETLLISALQGLANRDTASLYILFVQGFGHKTDEFWLNLFSQNWLRDRERRNVDSIDELLDLFADSYSGLVLYDGSVPSTVNVALTIAGADNLLPVRHDPSEGSLYRKLVDVRKIPVKARLINEDGSPLFTGVGKIPGTNLDSSGSIKTDPYYWAIENYIKSGKSNPTEGGYYIDAYWIQHPIGAVQNHCLTNRDFVVSRKGFFFDLSPWDDETPNDDREQKLGTDFNAFNAVMRAAYNAVDGKSVIRVCGFTPWDSKYTDHGNVGYSHSGVPTEWRHAEILSNHNGYLDADALGCGAMANASFYQHFPLDEIYPQQKPTVNDLRVKGYLDDNGKVADKTFVAIYAGDYDSAAWVYQSMPAFWHDPARGNIPINWAFNPNLADRFAPGFDYFRKTKTPNDFFVSGDSGAGYVNPTAFIAPRRFSQLPDGLDVWIEHCKKYFKRWDVSGIGFIIDGDARTCDRETLERLAAYAPDGMTTHRGPTMGVVDNPYGGRSAFRPMNHDLADPNHGTAVILGDVRKNQGAQFNMYRTILWSPQKLQTLFEQVKQDEDRGGRVEFVDAYTFWLLIRLEAQNLGVDEFDIRL
ncbi:MAG: GxGYxYP family putative glycoside hydrolase [Thermoguttaceae bacterium]|nr:GxGYxYP family putative glycoside hydrolase [Thermoguttaceae bacterium]